MKSFIVVLMASGAVALSMALGDKMASVERGKYLVEGIGCGDCHTPMLRSASGHFVPDSTHLFAGHPEGVPPPTWAWPDAQRRNSHASMGLDGTAWAGPWGVSFAANISPDNATGIGEWTEDAFVRALRTGKHQGQPNGREILPPMPWPAFRNLSDGDLKAIWAYLRTVEPVKNQVPFPIPPSAPPAPVPN